MVISLEDYSSLIVDVLVFIVSIWISCIGIIILGDDSFLLIEFSWFNVDFILVWYSMVCCMDFVLWCELCKKFYVELMVDEDD